MGKRGNGEGSIYRRKADGAWIAAVSIGDKRKVVSARTRREVAAKLDTLLAQKRGGRLTAEKSLTVAQFLERWLEDSVKPRVRPLTYAGYSVNVQKHLIPTIGKHRLDRLTPLHVEEMINNRLDAGFSAKSVAYIRQVLRTALEAAVRWELVPRNVASLVDPPRRETTTFEPLNPDEARRLLEVINGHRLEALFMVALVLGLRQGEALGLRWEDIDLDRGSLRVSYQLQRIDGHLTLVEPKTKKSRRTLAMPPLIIDALTRHRAIQAQERDLAGSKWVEHGLVFANRSGGPTQARDVIEVFHGLLAEAGLRRIRFHDLRHSCATLLLVQGVSPRVVMDILGHTEIAMTMNLYSHVIPEMHREAADRMEALLRSTPEAVPVGPDVAGPG